MRRPGFQKYGAKKTPCQSGHVHDSRREASRCNDLHRLLRAGEITHLELQQQFWFTINGVTLKHKNGHRVGVNIDFTYREKDGRAIAEDSKGFVVRDWPLRRAVFCALFPQFELREV